MACLFIYYLFISDIHSPFSKRSEYDLYVTSDSVHYWVRDVTQRGSDRKEPEQLKGITPKITHHSMLCYTPCFAKCILAWQEASHFLSKKKIINILAVGRNCVLLLPMGKTFRNYLFYENQCLLYSVKENILWKSILLYSVKKNNTGPWGRNFVHMTSKY